MKSINMQWGMREEGKRILEGGCWKKYLANIANARSVGKIINLIPNYNSCAFIKLYQIKAQKLSFYLQFPNTISTEFRVYRVYREWLQEKQRIVFYYRYIYNYILMRQIENLIEASHLIIRSLAKSFAQIKVKEISITLSYINYTLPSTLPLYSTPFALSFSLSLAHYLSISLAMLFANFHSLNQIQYWPKRRNEWELIQGLWQVWGQKWEERRGVRGRAWQLFGYSSSISI